jgi:hypothetical protein
MIHEEKSQPGSKMPVISESKLDEKLVIADNRFKNRRATEAIASTYCP